MLHTLSMDRALHVWSELEKAYFGKNSFGGDTAEILIAYFMSGGTCPTSLLEVPGIMGEVVRETYDQANQAMFELFTLFEKRRNVKLEVEGQALGPWLREARFCHRVHVKVLHQKTLNKRSKKGRISKKTLNGYPTV